MLHLYFTCWCDQIFLKMNHFLKFTFVDLTTQPRNLWLFSHACSTAQCRALTVDGILKLVFMLKVPSSTISPLHRVQLPFQLSPVVSILKLLIAATSNKCYSGQHNDNYCLKFTLTFILIGLHVILKFSSNCKGYAV